MTQVLEGTVITPFQVFSPGYVSVQDGKILYVGPTKPVNEKPLSFKDSYICPGLIDLHSHGARGHDVRDGRIETIQSFSKFLTQCGVTSYLPTVSSSSQEQSEKVAKTINDATEKNNSGATILGLHLEGPYINRSMKGAHNPEHIRPPSLSELSDIMKRGNLKLVTMAPEIEGAFEVIKWLKSKQVTVAAGHSAATYQQMLKGINAGIRHVAHLYNAMMGFHHREPGIFGSAFLDSRVSFELIPDGVHLHRVAYEIAIKLKEPSKTVLVSDSLPTAGFPDGEYNYGDLKILLKNGVARLESGALAGSNITLNEGIKYISELGLLKPRELIQMTTYSPATVIDVHHQKGSLMPGMDADIVVLDRNFDSKLTIIEGDIVYEGGV